MNQNIKQSFVFNLVIVLALCAILYACFFASLHWFTKHGQEVTIPDLRGKDVNTAVTQLGKLHFEVIVDSTYEPTAKPLVVLKQVPDTGAVVKQGRTVFLTVNMLTPPRIPMPNLVNLSMRSAEMILRNNKLLIGDTIFKPDIAAGAILEQRYKGQPIQPGEMVMQGSKIGLVIGNGQGNTEWEVPNVIGQSVDDATTILNQFNLQPVLVVDDMKSEISDTMLATIVCQEPKALNGDGGHNRIKMGEVITLHIKQDPKPEELCNSDNTKDHDDVK
jgi:beta-lactam-binding protein with PASTA domain